MEDGATIVNLSTTSDMVLNYVLIIVVTVLGVGVGWIIKRGEAALGIQIEAKHREALQTATSNGAAMILTELFQSRQPMTVDVKSVHLKRSIDYVMNRAAPDAVKHFGLTPETVADQVEAKLNKLLLERPVMIPTDPAP